MPSQSKRSSGASSAFSKHLFGKRRHRPTDVSRKMMRRHLQCETLEERLALSADTSASLLTEAYLQELGYTVKSYSSDNAEGAAIIAANELASAMGTTAEELAYILKSLPNDPYLGQQWYLINSGQQVGQENFQDIYAEPGEDINVAGAWNLGYTGDGVIVAVIDSGVQLLHPDLAANISDTLGLDTIGNDDDANPSPDDYHGTSVAGIIAAVGDNGIGTTGIAYDATIAPIRLAGTEQSIIEAFRYAIDEIDITNNSWGPPDIRQIAGPTYFELAAIRDSIYFGRDGLGVIHVWAAGNGGDVGDTSNYDGYVSSRYTIGVTGVDHDGFANNVDGTTTEYPETGSGVLVAAPTGSVWYNIGEDTGLGSGILTTDITGENGANGSNNEPDPYGLVDFDLDLFEDIDYTSRFNGTSASAPVVSGVIALMLEANPNLSWRDVQEILVRCARQNAETGMAADGFDKAQGIAHPNTWIMNQIQLFRDPDAYSSTLNPVYQTLAPTLDPTLSATAGTGVLRLGYAATPALMTNGAGYTVSQGMGTEGNWLGYAHGVVDATLAVQLAEQWTDKNQDLAPELTFTTSIFGIGDNLIPAAEVSNDDSGNQLVPGGLGGESGFIGYWDEYFLDPIEEDPFEDPGSFQNERSDGPLVFTVPDDQTMSIETVEVNLTLTGGASTLDHLRIVLVSPDGTHSELNHFYSADQGERSVQNVSQGSGNVFPIIEGIPGSIVEEDQFTVTFTTNRSWGERSDNSLLIDASTGLPYDAAGLGSFTSLMTDDGLLEQGWQLYFENWGNADATLVSAEVIWHGEPIGEDTYRVSGFVGIDDNQDDAFNYSRTVTEVLDLDGDPNTLRLGEINNYVVGEDTDIYDGQPESFASNITVTARRASDGVVVAQFVTGADGNYYFDLLPDDYIISIEDPLGRVAADDSQTPAGWLQNYQSEWTITEEWFNVWQRDSTLTDADGDGLVDVNLNANERVPVDGSGNPILWTASLTGQEVTYDVMNINFLLDPGPAAANQVNFSGIVFADFDGDGVLDGNDVLLESVRVYADMNQNGEFDAGEVLVQTDASGQYSLTVDDVYYSQVMNVGVIAPVDWAFGLPETGLNNVFVSPGDVIADVDFSLTPPSSSTGDGSSSVGNLLGVVFSDNNQDGYRQATEVGLGNITVYIDANDNGVLDAGDTQTTTNSGGAFAFSDVPAGQVVVRVDADAQFDQTLPFYNAGRVVTLSGAGTISGLLFGLYDTAEEDYGDLPAMYGETAANAARHTRGSYFLGASIDGEFAPLTSANADGDDTTGIDDEDGVVFSTLTAGLSGSYVVTASRSGGYLQAWFDWNGDGDFDDTVDGISERVAQNVLLQPGQNLLNLEVPTSASGTVFARFRYGGYGLNSAFGFSSFGEVEDYAISIVTPPGPVVFANGPDFNNDESVDIFDLMAWQRGYGTTSGATAADGDADGDGDVDKYDKSQWKVEFGTGQVFTPPPVLSGNFDGDSDVDIADLMALQRGYGTTGDATLADGDGNGDGNVTAEDFDAWQSLFGIGQNDGNIGYNSQGSNGGSSSDTTTSTERYYQVLLVSDVTMKFQDSLPLAAATTTETAAADAVTVDPAATTDQGGHRFAAGQAFANRFANRFARIERNERTAEEACSGVVDTSYFHPVSSDDLGWGGRDTAVERMFGHRHRSGDRLHSLLGDEDFSDYDLEEAFAQLEI